VQYRMSRAVAGPLLRLLWRPKITGIEHIPATGGAILASNHLSIVDSIFLPLMLDRPLTFAAKSEYFTGKGLTQRLTGAYMRATKQLSVDRASSRASCSAYTRKAPGPRMGGCTAAGPASAGWRSTRGCRSSRWP
jgi:1-acyl-sn-glycerol-3-phosphate acyltransferase